MFKEMQILGKLSSYREGEPNPVSARTMVEMVDDRAARALGLERWPARSKPGKRADVIALDLDEIGWGPSAQDVYTALAYSISGLHVTDSMVNGRWLMRDRRLLTVDYRAECDGSGRRGGGTARLPRQRCERDSAPQESGPCRAGLLV